MRLTPEEIRDMDTEVEKFPEIFRTYNAKLRQMQMIDYDDQMIYALRILEQYPEVLAYFREKYQYFCVDEAQDTSKIQHDMMDLLAAKAEICSWWGMKIRVFMGSGRHIPGHWWNSKADIPGRSCCLWRRITAADRRSSGRRIN